MDTNQPPVQMQTNSRKSKKKHKKKKTTPNIVHAKYKTFTVNPGQYSEPNENSKVWT